MTPWVQLLNIGLLGIVVATISLTLAVIIYSARHFRQLPHLDSVKSISSAQLSSSLPSVALIIPMRNERGVIGRLVNSVQVLNYPASAFTVLVVDDQSTDGSGAEVQALGTPVLRLESDPPAGWTGKCNACEQGVHATAASASKWLLFTDADTVHQPDSLLAALRYAEAEQLDALSLLLRQECDSVWERLVLPLAYQNLFASLTPDRPALNGQYILIRRDVYYRSGGFGAVRGQVMEDLAFGKHLAEQGFRLRLIEGHQLASVRMYQDVGALWRGMTKTAFSAARHQGTSGMLLALPFFLGVWLVPIMLTGVWLQQPLLSGGSLLSLVLTSIGVLPWLRRFGVSPIYAIFSYIGLAFLWAAGLVSTMRGIFGLGVRWKDRTIVEGRS